MGLGVSGFDFGVGCLVGICFDYLFCCWCELWVLIRFAGFGCLCLLRGVAYAFC